MVHLYYCMIHLYYFIKRIVQAHKEHKQRQPISDSKRDNSNKKIG